MAEGLPWIFRGLISSTLSIFSFITATIAGPCAHFTFGSFSARHCLSYVSMLSSDILAALPIHSCNGRHLTHWIARLNKWKDTFFDDGGGLAIPWIVLFFWTLDCIIHDFVEGVSCDACLSDLLPIQNCFSREVDLWFLMFEEVEQELN